MAQIAEMVEMKIIDYMDVVAYMTQIGVVAERSEIIEMGEDISLSGLWWGGAYIGVAVKCDDPSKVLCEVTLSDAPSTIVTQMNVYYRQCTIILQINGPILKQTGLITQILHT